VNDLYNSITNKVPSVVSRMPLETKAESTTSFGKSVNYYFDETASGTVFFQFNKRLEFDVRRGDFNEIAALDLALTTNAVNIDYKNHCMTGISKPESMDLSE
jgi:iron complex outermembrane receptor protein